MSGSTHQVTQALLDLRRENHSAEALQELWDLVYPELRIVAGQMMLRESGAHTLQPTALVHEAYLKLVDQQRVDWKDRAQFFAVAARIMRRILVDHARSQNAQKRGGQRQRVTLQTNISDPGARDIVEFVALDRALSELEEEDPRVSRVVELRIFAGLPMREVAHALNISKRTADSDWAFATRWLAAKLDIERDEK